MSGGYVDECLSRTAKRRAIPRLKQLESRVAKLDMRRRDALLTMMIGGAAIASRTPSFVSLLDIMLPLAERWQKQTHKPHL